MLLETLADEHDYLPAKCYMLQYQTGKKYLEDGLRDLIFKAKKLNYTSHEIRALLAEHKVFSSFKDKGKLDIFYHALNSFD